MGKLGDFLPTKTGKLSNKVMINGLVYPRGIQFGSLNDILRYFINENLEETRFFYLNASDHIAAA